MNCIFSIDYFKTNCLSDQMYKSYRTYARKKIKLRALLEIYIFSKSLSSDLDISHVSHLKKNRISHYCRFVSFFSVLRRMSKIRKFNTKTNLHAKSCIKFKMDLSHNFPSHIVVFVFTTKTYARNSKNMHF